METRPVPLSIPDIHALCYAIDDRIKALGRELPAPPGVPQNQSWAFHEDLLNRLLAAAKAPPPKPATKRKQPAKPKAAVPKTPAAGKPAKAPAKKPAAKE